MKNIALTSTLVKVGTIRKSENNVYATSLSIMQKIASKIFSAIQKCKIKTLNFKNMSNIPSLSEQCTCISS